MNLVQFSACYSMGPGRVHRRLVNEAGDVPEDMEVGSHFHVLAR